MSRIGKRVTAAQPIWQSDRGVYYLVQDRIRRTPHSQERGMAFTDAIELDDNGYAVSDQVQARKLIRESDVKQADEIWEDLN